MKAKPDNRDDNVEKLQEAVQNTIGNLREAEDYLEEFGDELGNNEQQAIESKNDRRKESIRGFREEIKDEAQAEQQRNS
ncbi:small acid-soluble spore protein Tlp [Chengkuizengella axinellae]|uniref:Small acid-soluble spore protein Tlp n=1 Tax=Chengkuizengella axinellae TaxID=3064388 RepID=A0ABT9IY37_9BACL|nr:small acid-soluble spore protein Tlp [Chengkuizengella sp. 2205SS18-9]MDP5274037.1 small acid-soluble spore protein Tlp [Chengkuizengella sp. 2205SS18-9]